MDFEAKAKEINSQMDVWIQTERARGTFPGNGLQGQEYYASLVSTALHEAYVQGLNLGKVLGENSPAVLDKIELAFKQGKIDENSACAQIAEQMGTGILGEYTGNVETAIRESVDADETEKEESHVTLQGMKVLQTNILTAVSAHMDWTAEKALVWYQTPNPNFGGCSPADLVIRGRGHKVLQFIKAAVNEAKGLDTSTPKESK